MPLHRVKSGLSMAGGRDASCDDADRQKIDVGSFKLTRWFALLSLVAIIAIATTTGLVRTHWLTKGILDREASVTMEFVVTILDAANKRHAREPHHTHDTAVDHFLRRDHNKASLELGEFFGLIVGMPDVLRANVFGEDGMIAWSSSPELIGMKFEDNDDLDKAFDGEVVAELGVAHEYARAKTEHVFFDGPKTQFIEFYLPIWDAQHSSIVGVVEIYKAPDKVLAMIATGRWHIWSSAAIGGLVLFIVLFWIARRADSIIRRQQERLVEAETLASVGEVVSAVAHGFRNPLASIRTSAELMASEDISESRREGLVDITRLADRMEHHVRALLGFAQDGVDQVERIQVNDLIENCVEALADTVQKSGVTMESRMCENLPAVQGNATALSQVLDGLIANGLEAMPDGGKLILSSELTADGADVLVTVEDNGVGIAENEVEQVFRPYATTKSAGLGLGLPVARRLVERHGGTLVLSSRPGDGTIVTMRIPVSQ